MWDLERRVPKSFWEELKMAQDEASRLGHKLGPFKSASGEFEWISICERCGRVCTVERSADDSEASRRSGEVWAGPCQPPHIPGPEGGEAVPVPRRPMESVGSSSCSSKKAA